MNKNSVYCQNNRLRGRGSNSPFYALKLLRDSCCIRDPPSVSKGLRDNQLLQSKFFDKFFEIHINMNSVYSQNNRLWSRGSYGLIHESNDLSVQLRLTCTSKTKQRVNSRIDVWFVTWING